MLIEETEHWRFVLIPEYRRKPFTKVYEKKICPYCNGLSVNSVFKLDVHNCDWCHSSGEINVDVTPRPPEPPEIPMSYIEHMKKAHKEYMNSQLSAKE